MTGKQWRTRIIYAIQYVPFTLHAVLLTVVVWVSYKLLYRQPAVKEDNTDTIRPFVILMSSFVLWFLVALVVLSIISTLFAWLHFLWLRSKKNGRLNVSFHMDRNHSGNRTRLFIDTELPDAIKPLLGFVKARLFYDKHQMTDKFGLLSGRNKKNSLLREAVTGRSRIVLPDIKEYRIEGGFIYFEDIFQIISLPVKQNLSGDFYQPPTTVQETIDEVAPKKTDTMDIRIDQLRKVEGEYLNYKSFESGDDVRRIVWKVYAKNRELVVRIPERMEPYASHLYFYASFHNSLSGNGLRNNDYFSEMLNFYKKNVWAIYEALAQKEWQIRYIPDQQFSSTEHLSEKEKNERIVSNSVWQKDLPLREYFNPQAGTVLVISSLTDPKELALLLDECDSSVQIYYIQLSTVFKHYAALGWMKRLIFLPPKDRLSRLKNRWIFTPLRAQLRKREQEIERLLAKK